MAGKRDVKMLRDPILVAWTGTGAQIRWMDDSRPLNCFCLIALLRHIPGNWTVAPTLAGSAQSKRLPVEPVFPRRGRGQGCVTPPATEVC